MAKESLAESSRSPKRDCRSYVRVQDFIRTLLGCTTVVFHSWVLNLDAHLSGIYWLLFPNICRQDSMNGIRHLKMTPESLAYDNHNTLLTPWSNFCETVESVADFNHVSIMTNYIFSGMGIDLSRDWCTYCAGAASFYRPRLPRVKSVCEIANLESG